MIMVTEEEGAEVAVGGKRNAGAMAAEGLGDRGDKADFAGSAVGEAVLAGGFAALVGDLFERPAGVDTPMDLRGGDHGGARPVAGWVQAREIDEEHNKTPGAGENCKNCNSVIAVEAGQRSQRSASKWPLVVMERSSTPRAWRRAM